jgi:uncharacterized protein (TIGR04255 family)
MKRELNPFAEHRPEVPLSHPPLIHVICQVRFPVIASMNNESFIAPFQEAIRQIYPHLDAEILHGFAVSDQGVAKVENELIWRLSDRKKEWIVSLSSSFLSLETTTYTSRADLLQRMDVLLTALIEQIKPESVERLGLRYIDRLEGEVLNQIDKFIHTDFLGISNPVLRQQSQHMLSECLMKIDAQDNWLRARWGFLPPQAMIEPNVPATQQPSWILDIDTFSTPKLSLGKQSILQCLQELATYSYTFFRWAVTEDFLNHYKG